MYSSLFRVGCLLFSTAAAIQKTPSVEPLEAHGEASVANKRDKTLLYIGVSSAAGDVNAREAARDCWMKHNLLQGDNPPVVAKFMVAKPPEGSKEKLILEKDMAEHPHDFIQVDAPEGWQNLTKKVTAFFRWAVDDQQAQYYMKIDDNNFPNVQVMYDHFSKSVKSGVKYQYSGDIQSGWMAKPWGQYAQDPAGWMPWSTYPDYCSGDGYVLSSDLVDFCFGEPYERQGRWDLDNEDVHVGFWIDHANKNGVTVSYDQFTERIDFSCNPIGSNATRCCAADKSDMGSQNWTDGHIDEDDQMKHL